MEISAIGGVGTQTQATQSSQSEIKILENKKERLQEQINKLNQQDTSQDKEKQIQVLEAQIQLIDAQIQAIQRRQSQAKSGGASSAQGAQAPAKPVSGSVDVEA